MCIFYDLHNLFCKILFFEYFFIHLNSIAFLICRIRVKIGSAKQNSNRCVDFRAKKATAYSPHFSDKL